MTKLLMPEATALWLIHHTGITFHQIAQFCGLSILHVEALADGKMRYLSEANPLSNGQLTQEEIHASTKDPKRPLVLQDTLGRYMKKKKSKPYISLNKRQNRPHGILWLVKNYPEVTDQRICQLLGTTRPTIASVRNKTHWDYAQIVPKHPVFLGLCSQEAFDHFTQEMEEIAQKSQEQAQNDPLENGTPLHNEKSIQKEDRTPTSSPEEDSANEDQQ